MAVIETGGTVWAVATRICQLDPTGAIVPGSNTFTTDTLLKATITPVTEAGDAINVKNAAGDLSVFGKHGDMIKWGTIDLELTKPVPLLEQVLCGGTVLSSVAAALGLTTGLTATPQATLGTLATGSYGYRATQYNSFGETLAEAEVVATVSGSTGAVVLSGVVPAAGALGIGYYGRGLGGEQLLGYQPVIGSQATSAASGTGAVASLSVTPLTAPIPSGFTFQITGDTNTVKIVFTTTAPSGVGATLIPVTVSQSVTTTIAAAAIVPVMFDTGAITPAGGLPTVDLSAGPGTGAGYAMPNLGPVGNPNGVSCEFWMKRMVKGYQASDWPYRRFIVPRCTGLNVGARDFANTNVASVFKGDVFQNQNWGSGPDGTWPAISTQMVAHQVTGAQTLPTAGLSPTPAAL